MYVYPLYRLAEIDSDYWLVRDNIREGVNNKKLTLLIIGHASKLCLPSPLNPLDREQKNK